MGQADRANERGGPGGTNKDRGSPGGRNTGFDKDDDDDFKPTINTAWDETKQGSARSYLKRGTPEPSGSTQGLSGGWSSSPNISGESNFGADTTKLSSESDFSGVNRDRLAGGGNFKDIGQRTKEYNKSNAAWNAVQTFNSLLGLTNPYTGLVGGFAINKLGNKPKQEDETQSQYDGRMDAMENGLSGVASMGLDVGAGLLGAPRGLTTIGKVGLNAASRSANAYGSQDIASKDNDGKEKESSVQQASSKQQGIKQGYNNAFAAFQALYQPEEEKDGQHIVPSGFASNPGNYELKFNR